ncbi:hypothetical protein J6590_018897 [Homalodisca vitripennis]|nr:hypothetical protein J6590_018897 [Homalodisca vitripennis]
MDHTSESWDSPTSPVPVNDLSLDGKALLFADNTTICHTGTSLAGVIRGTDSLLNRAKLWFTSNKFKLNEEKTQRMICSLGPQVEETSQVSSC